MIEFEDIYLKYFSDVFSFILRLSGDELVAEDITSETFIKAMKTFDKFRGDCDVRVWLCQIAKNTYYSYLKKIRREEYIDETELIAIPSEEASVEDQLIKKEQLEAVRKALYQIPKQYKEVYIWRVFARLSFKQIGQVLGKTENWACVTYHRAVRMIKDRVGDDVDGK